MQPHRCRLQSQGTWHELDFLGTDIPPQGMSPAPHASGTAQQLGGIWLQSDVLPPLF